MLDNRSKDTGVGPCLLILTKKFLAYLPLISAIPIAMAPEKVNAVFYFELVFPMPLALALRMNAVNEGFKSVRFVFSNNSIPPI